MQGAPVLSAEEEDLAARAPRLRCAWEEDAEKTIPCEAPASAPTLSKVPCLACERMGDDSLTARIMRSDGIGLEKTIFAGSHAFVRLPGDGFIRMGSMAFDFGKACGHPLLSHKEPAPVLFAGPSPILWPS